MWLIGLTCAFNSIASTLELSTVVMRQAWWYKTNFMWKADQGTVPSGAYNVKLFIHNWGLFQSLALCILFFIQTMICIYIICASSSSFKLFVHSLLNSNYLCIVFLQDHNATQEALAQMESNAAAAMAKFKSFSRPSSSPKATTKDSASAKEALDKTVEEELASPSSQQQSSQKTSLTASQGNLYLTYNFWRYLEM